MDKNLNIKVNKNKKNIKIIFMAIILIIYIISLCKVKIQSDTFFDIKCGELYQTRGITNEDIFSVHDGLKYISQHFIVTIIVYNVYLHFRFVGLYILQIIIALIVSMLFYRLNYLITKDKIFSYISLYIEMFFIGNFLSVRAYMFSIVLFLVQLIVITLLRNENLKKSGKWIIYITLTIIPMLITNFHAGVWPFYYIIMGVYILDAFIKYNKKLMISLIIISLISIPLMFLNAFGIDNVLYVFKTVGNTFINEYISEFQSLTIENNPIGFVFMILTVIIYSASKSSKNPYEIFILIITSIMALISVRHYMLFIICFPLILNSFKGEFKIVKDICNSNKGIVFVVLLVLYIQIIASNFSIKTYNFFYDNYPERAIEYIKENISEDKIILNSYNYGSYMLFNDIKVFVDNRCDLYTYEYNKVEIAKDAEKFRNNATYYMDIIEKYSVDYVFVELNSNVVEYLRKDTNFKNVYEDEKSIIFECIK